MHSRQAAASSCFGFKLAAVSRKNLLVPLSILRKRLALLSMDAPVYYPTQECHRMHLLRSTLPICLDKTFEQFSYAAFCSCFDEKVTIETARGTRRCFPIPLRNKYVYSTNLLPKVVKPNGELFENLYMQLVDILKNFVQTEFDLLLFQSEVGSRLSLMENWIALAQRQVRPPSPTRPEAAAPH